MRTTSEFLGGVFFFWGGQAIKDADPLLKL